MLFRSTIARFNKVPYKIGRKVVKLLGDEAYENGYLKGDGYKSKKERFVDMLSYVQDNYLRSPVIKVGDNFLDLVARAQEMEKANVNNL